MCLPKDKNKIEEYKKRLKEKANKRWENKEQRKIASNSKIGEKNPMFGMCGDKNPMYGIKRTDEWKKNQSERKIKLFKEHPEKHPMLGRTGDKHPFYGKRGKETFNYKGGKKKKNGYVYILSHGHPFADKTNYVAEHRLVIEKQLGRYLTHDEIPHHINDIKDDNRPENLYLFENRGKHKKFHWNPYILKSNIIKL